MTGTDARRPGTMVEYLSDQLRSEIVTGALQAGATLPLAQLAERFGTSVIPVREALRGLSTEGLVTLRPHRSAVVSELPLPDLDELYHARSVLEQEALRMADGKLNAADKVRVSVLINQMESELADGHLTRGFEIHRDLHMTLYRHCESELMIDIIERLWADSERYRLASMPVRSDASIVAAEHWEFIRPLFDGDLDKATAELHRHLMRTRDALHVARALAETANVRSGGDGSPASLPEDLIPL